LGWQAIGHEHAVSSSSSSGNGALHHGHCAQRTGVVQVLIVRNDDFALAISQEPRDIWIECVEFAGGIGTTTAFQRLLHGPGAKAAFRDGLHALSFFVPGARRLLELPATTNAPCDKWTRRSHSSGTRVTYRIAAVRHRAGFA
jgi:hypothetical protein